MTITPNQKKTVWICSAVLVAAYYAPAIITSVASSSYRESPPAVTPKVSAPFAAAAPFRSVVGTFFARTPLTGRGVCSFKFELRQNLEKAGTFKGYVTLTCIPVAPRQWRPNMVAISGAKTISAILTGVPETGAIRFHVDDAFNTSGGCSPKAFVLKPFGLNQIVIEWEEREDSCRGGAMTLARVGR